MAGCNCNSTSVAPIKQAGEMCILSPPLRSCCLQDEEAELLAELERIKKERAEEAARKQKTVDAEKESQLREEVARGNPLLNQNLAFQVKRRWDDDVVFRNQARGEPKAQKRFVNYTIRNDFHKRFLNRYIK